MNRWRGNLTSKRTAQCPHNCRVISWDPLLNHILLIHFSLSNSWLDRAAPALYTFASNHLVCLLTSTTHPSIHPCRYQPLPLFLFPRCLLVNKTSFVFLQSNFRNRPPGACLPIIVFAAWWLIWPTPCGTWVHRSSARANTHARSFTPTRIIVLHTNHEEQHNQALLGKTTKHWLRPAKSADHPSEGDHNTFKMSIEASSLLYALMHWWK